VTEKIIKGLVEARRVIKEHVPVRYWGYSVRACSDAVDMLKTQEPVEPVVDIDTWKCGNCGHTLEHQQLLGDNVLFHEQYNYCPECGKAVKWE
jgi:ribosomal protein S27AE